MNYEDLIARKTASLDPSGFSVPEEALSGHLFPHQRDLVRWAIRRGRAAIFAATGLGKGLMLIEWARLIAAEHGRVLILAPLAVGPQLASEAKRFGVPAFYVAQDDGYDIQITNYEKLHKFDLSDYAGVVLDESSILKSMDGKTKMRLIQGFAETPYKLACTATPAPNDFTELGNHSEFLGLKSRSEMLAEFFVHDGGSTQDWRVKGHAITAFWRWVATWGAVVRLPSDLGYEDGDFALPPMVMTDYVVVSTPEQRAAAGLDGRELAVTLTEQRKARRATLEGRVGEAERLVRAYGEAGEQCVVWCDLNDEQALLASRLGEWAVSIEGATKDELKIARHETWKAGEVAALISKPAIFGFGLNWQHCHHVIFIGASHQFERTYQAIRRCWRFGQTETVTVDMVRADLEGAVAENYARKERDHERMGKAMIELVGETIRAEVKGLAREFNPYVPEQDLILPPWLVSEVSCAAE